MSLPSQDMSKKRWVYKSYKCDIEKYYTNRFWQKVFNMNFLASTIALESTNDYISLTNLIPTFDTMREVIQSLLAEHIEPEVCYQSEL